MLLAFIIGGLASNIYAQTIRLIEVPEYINGYSTIDLLNYPSQLKANDNGNKIITQPVPSTIRQDDTLKIPSVIPLMFPPSNMKGNASA